MDYKKIIQSRSMRIKIMQALSFVPDKQMVELQYRIKTGRRLDLKNPRRYTEKLQWYKLHYRNPVMTQCADKYDVRSFVESRGLDKILNELYGVFDSPDEINYDELPDSFVLKDTLGGGGNSVILVKNKNEIDRKALYQQMKKWVDEPVNKKSVGREWVYDKRKHRIVIEKLLKQKNGDLADYKFYCFDGKVFCFYVRTDYVNSHAEGKMVFFNRNKDHMAGVGMDYCKSASIAPALPKEIDEMIGLAEILSDGFPHVRVDLYNIDGKIVLGEMTFFNASGYFLFEPDEFDFVIGNCFKLPGIARS